MDYGDLGAGVGGWLGALIGDPLTAGERQRYLDTIRSQRGLYQNLPTDLQAQQESTVDLGPSAFESLSVDPSMRAAQAGSLQQLQAIANAKGMDPQFRNALAQSQAANAQQERAQRQGILDTFARRGMGNSNAALLASLSSQQGSAQRAGMEGLQAGADAAARQYRAIGDAAGLAGQIHGQDYSEAAARANAMDRVAQYNAANRQAVIQRNTGARNQFTQGNADLAYRRAGDIAGTYQQEGNYWQNRERQRRALFQGAGSGLGYMAGTAAGGLP